MQRWSREPARLRWRAISLVYSTWPVYVAALFCALFRWKVDYLPTPKVFQTGNYLPLAAPQFFAAAGLLVGLTWLMNASGFTQASFAVEGFACLLVLANASLTVGVVEGLQSRPMKRLEQARHSLARSLFHLVQGDAGPASPDINYIVAPKILKEKPLRIAVKCP